MDLPDDIPNTAVLYMATPVVGGDSVISSNVGDVLQHVKSKVVLFRVLSWVKMLTLQLTFSKVFPVYLSNYEDEDFRTAVLAFCHVHVDDTILNECLSESLFHDLLSQRTNFEKFGAEVTLSVPFVNHLRVSLALKVPSRSNSYLVATLDWRKNSGSNLLAVAKALDLNVDASDTATQLLRALYIPPVNNPSLHVTVYVTHDLPQFSSWSSGDESSFSVDESSLSVYYSSLPVDATAQFTYVTESFLLNTIAS